MRTPPVRLRRLPLLRDWWDAFEGMQAARDRALAEREAALAERDAAWRERDAAVERDRTSREAREVARTERAAAFAERDTAIGERDAAAAERDAAAAERDAAAAERDAAAAERDTAIAARDAAAAERDAAVAEREAVLVGARALQVEADAMRLELDALRPPSEEQIGATVRDRLHVPAKPRRAAGRTAVLVPVHGAIAGREVEVTQPFFVDYCRNIGADLHIVDVPESVPDLLVKASLLPIARDYRRFAMIDSNVLIRKECPDLFAAAPEDALGAVCEGRWVDRGDACAELSEIYGFSAPLPADHYVDTGVMVMSQSHLPLLEAMLQSPVLLHPRGEQDFVNACLYRNNVRLHGLGREFNWIPYMPEDFDWRWAWIFHIGDCWRTPPRQQTAVRRDNERRGPRRLALPLEPRHCRLPCLIEVAGQLRGETIRVAHAAEMGYHPPAGRMMITEDDAAVMSCTPWARARPAWLPALPPIYGPYAALVAGRWSVALLAADGKSPADGDIVVDIVHDFGNVTVRRPQPIGPGGTFEIEFDRNVENVEVRLYRSDREFAVSAIVFRRLTADGRAAA